MMLSARLFSLCSATLVLFAVATLVADEAKDDLPALAGEWKRVRQVNMGEEEKIDAEEALRIRIRDDKLTLWREGEKIADVELQLTLTPTTNPKLIDLKLPEGRVLEGIYKLDGKQWQLCLNTDADIRERPDSFDTKSGDKRVFVLLEKVAD